MSMASKTFTVSIIVSGEGFESADDVTLAVCAGMDWFNEYGPDSKSLEYVGDDEVL
jgi:hypothetical protein